jgi:hypothetical protein
VLRRTREHILFFLGDVVAVIHEVAGKRGFHLGARHQRAAEDRLDLGEQRLAGLRASPYSREIGAASAAGSLMAAWCPAPASAA